MIVKNEEKHLAGCLESVMGLVDQIVVVDTGSTDSTVEIARACGAEVFFFSWCNDFSAARNEALRHASGDWILSMDADERLNSVGLTDCLRKSASIPGTDGFSIPIRSPKQNEGEAYDFHYAIRFFRRFAGIHFVGEVHELIDPFLRERKAGIGRASFVIEHLGYAVDSLKMEEKLSRNLSLLQKSRERDPDNAFTLYCLGRTLLGLKKEKEGFAVLERALKAKGLTPNLRASALNLMTYCHISEQDYSKAEETALLSLDAVRNQNTARLYLGVAYFNQKRYEQAASCLFEAYRFQRQAPEKRLTDISEEHSFSETDLVRALARSYAELGRFGEAIAYFQLYLKRKDKDCEVVSMMGITYLNARDFAQALFYLKQALDLGMAPEPLAIPFACAHFRLGEMEQAGEWLLKAEESSLMSKEGETLVDSMVDFYLGKYLPNDACSLLEKLAHKFPACPKFLDALGFACIKAGDFRKAIEAYVKLSALIPANPDLARRLAGLFVKIGDIESARRLLAS